MGQYLHVGGQMDGQRLSYPDDREVVRWMDGLYKRMPVAGNTERFDIFVHEDLDADEVMRRLLTGYRNAGRLGQFIGSIHATTRDVRQN